MKLYLKVLLLFMAASTTFLAGCSKRNSLATTITGIFTSQQKDGTLVGTFVAKGEFVSQGDCYMDVTPVGADSIHCINKHVTPVGNFTVRMNCSLANGTGQWHVVSGTGAYSTLHGGGSLTMPSLPGALAVEAMTGEVWFNR